MQFTWGLDVLDCNIGAFGTLYETIFNWILLWPSYWGNALECEYKNFIMDKKPIWKLGYD